jgi:hypothetical protein
VGDRARPRPPRGRHRKLTLVFRDLGRGRHKLTLLAVAAHGKRTVIGPTTVAVSLYARDLAGVTCTKDPRVDAYVDGLPQCQ